MQAVHRQCRFVQQRMQQEGINALDMVAAVVCARLRKQYSCMPAECVATWLDQS